MTEEASTYSGPETRAAVERVLPEEAGGFGRAGRAEGCRVTAVSRLPAAVAAALTAVIRSLAAHPTRG